MSSEVVIVGSGLMTPVGLSTQETAASTRSRTARLTSIDWRDSRFQPFTVGEVPADGIPPLQPELEKLPLTYREKRMLCLADPAMKEALQKLPKTAKPISALVGLPELHTTIPLKGPDFLARLAGQTGAALDLANSVAFSHGRASALEALSEACDRLSQDKAEFVLVGGVDCQVDLDVLGILDAQKRVRNSANPDGFAPGEGAGFLLLTTSQIAQKHSLNVLAKVIANGTAKEEGHIYSDKPYKGEGLAAAFENLFSNTPDIPPIGCVYASFNGEHYWAKEFGVAMARNQKRFVEGHQMEHPAECFGDLGSAHGAVMLGLAAAGLKRARQNTATLLYASSDLGDRNVTLLTAGT